MSHEYKSYWVSDKKAETGIREKVLKSMKRCFTSLRESFIPGWSYCPCCGYAKSPAEARFDQALAQAVASESARAALAVAVAA